MKTQPVERFFMAFCLLAFLAIPLRAQGQMPPNLAFKWWDHAGVVGELGLTKDQSQRIELIWREGRRSLIDLRAEHDRQQLDLENMLLAPTYDEVAVKAKIDKLYRAKGEIEKVTLLLRLKIREILTPDQRERSKELLERFRLAEQERKAANQPKPVNPQLKLPPRTTERVPDTLPPKK